MQLVELSTRVCPTRRFSHMSGFINRLVPAVRFSLNDSRCCCGWAWLRDDDSGLIEEEFKLDLDRWEELAGDIEAWLAAPHYSMRREIVEWMNDALTRTGGACPQPCAVKGRSTLHLVDSALLYPE
jgi:hypothetical protein